MPDTLQSDTSQNGDRATVAAGSFTTAERDALIARLHAAWKKLPASAQAAANPILAEGHQQLMSFVMKGTPPTHHTQMSLRLQCILDGDWAKYLSPGGMPLDLGVAKSPAAPSPSRAIEFSTSPDGSILGTGAYQQLDPRWELVAGSVWLEHLLAKHTFPSGAPAEPKTIPETTSLAILSDWGTGNFGTGDAPGVQIAKAVLTLRPNYTIHLGDVYYAGQSSEETDNFLKYWPHAASGSFALNSNHDMYSGGGPYFDMVLGDASFKDQAPWSFFALQNTHWLILGLDSAYFSSAVELYLNGTLGENNAQTRWLQTMARHAGQTGRKVILLTHHNPIPVGGVPKQNPPAPLQLYKDVTAAFAGQPAPAYWYYGHEHVGAAYAPLDGNGIRCRCLGHGGLPWGQSSDLAAGQSAGLVEWYEDRLAGDAGDPRRVYNGFLFLELNGPDLTETYYDELGRVAKRVR